MDLVQKIEALIRFKSETGNNDEIMKCFNFIKQ